jgi:HSP20 family protein
MKNFVSFSQDTIYPGVYVPLIKGKEVLDELKHLKKEDMVHPSVNIAELPDSFKIEMAIPGMKREEIMIDAEDHKLFVYGAHKKIYESEDQVGTTCGGFGKRIKLPKNADIEFASAEYKSGILSICFLKTKKSINKKLRTQLVVY